MRPRSTRKVPLGLLVPAILCVACGADEGAEAPPPLTGDLTRFDLVVENATSRPLPRAEVWVDAPRVASADWRRSGIEVSRPYSLEPRAYGNERIRLSFENVPVGFSERVSVRASLEPDGEDAPDADPATYLEPVSGFDAAALAARAEALTGAEDAATVDNVIAWVGAGAQGEEGAGLRAAAASAGAAAGDDDAALAEGGPRGPDGELLVEETRPPAREEVWLAVALLRAAEVPARVVAGFSDAGDGALRAERFSLWLEAHVEGRWETRRIVVQEPAERVVAMRIVGQPDDLLFGPVAESLAESAGLRVSFQ